MGMIEISRTRKIIAWILAGLLTALYLWSAWGKFMHPEFFVNNMVKWRVIIAIGELTSAILFLIPATNKFGTLLLSSLMGGAILFHMVSGISILMPTSVLILVWVVAFLRNPELYKM